MDKVGYTWGAAIDFNQKYWAFRVGYFLLPVLSNDNRFDTQITKHGEYIGELELRYSLLSQPGKLRLMAWASVGNAGSYSEAVASPPTLPITPISHSTRQNTRTNYGFVVNVEQALTDQLGPFLRTSWNAGRTEILGWTDCNESFSLGAVLRGKGWGRPDDKIGVAGVINGLSPQARAYSAAGGPRRLDRRWPAQLSAGEDHRSDPCVQTQQLVRADLRLSIHSGPRLQRRPRTGVVLRHAVSCRVLIVLNGEARRHSSGSGRRPVFHHAGCKRTDNRMSGSASRTSATWRSSSPMSKSPPKPISRTGPAALEG